MSEESDVKSLKTRKQLLLVESELNRAQLLRECALLADQLRDVTERVFSLKGMLARAFSFFQSKFSNGESEGATSGEESNSKSSWMTMAMRGVRLGTSLWLALRSRSGL